ncbi:hypothetical protein FCOIX_1182 [Fusarium coicis]|nr:hypothetical protein FCOIX_1182 [Fusarium coicis]
MPSPVLLSLPTELITRIIDLVDPSTHLNLACACTHLFKCAKKTLTHHQEAHSKFSFVSDLEPSTIPTLLRSVSGITSPIDAWHVRHIELWGSRQRRRHVFSKASRLEWVIPRWELAHYLKIMREELGLPEDLVDLARVAFERGCDSAMQMLLIVLCPRLESLKFMYNRHDKVESRRGLHWLTFVFGKSWLDGSWPPGLQSLRDVAVGLTSKTYLCTFEDCDHKITPRSMVRMWLLRTDILVTTEDSNDLLSFAFYDFPWDDQDGQVQELEEVWKDTSRHQDCAELIAVLFPPSLEVLILGNSAGVTSMEMEEDVLIRIIRSNKLPCLKAIFIEVPDDAGEIYPLTKLYEVGWEEGVDIRVKMNAQVPRHQIQLPMAPRVTSYKSRQKGQQSEFDAFRGCWREAARDTQVHEQTGDVSVDDVFEALDEDVETDDDYPDLYRQYYG